MNLFSVPDAVHSIAIGDLLFSLSSIVVHIIEVSASKSASKSCTTSLSGEDHSSVVLGIQYDPTYADEVICWIYLGINVVNILLAILLWQAVTKGCILKCTSYLVVSPVVIAIGLSAVIVHGILLGKYPHYYALGMYPCYFTYKVFSLWLVNRFRGELKESPVKKRRHGYSNIGDGDDPSADTIGDDSASGGYHYEDEGLKLELKMPSKYEISEDRLQLDHKTCLEYDEFVAVIRGLLNVDTDTSKDKGNFAEVAAKTLKVTTPTIPYGKRLLEEAKLVILIGPHDHILKFYGVCTVMQPKEKLFLITEYYPRGNLDTFLKDCVDTYGGKTFRNLLNAQGLIEVRSEKMLYENLPISKLEFTTIDMIQWAYQIASAMEHLHTKRVIYGYLKAKCIVLIKTSVVKLTGFAFPTKLYRARRTVKREDLPSRFPWRWTALECIESTDYVKFSTRSDVWSYGVTLWEIFSLSEVPYGAWDTDIVRNLISGLRLEKPRYSPCQIYEIMGACWRQHPGDRPNFYLLKLFFQQLLSSLTKSSM